MHWASVAFLALASFHGIHLQSGDGVAGRAWVSDPVRWCHHRAIARAIASALAVRRCRTPGRSLCFQPCRALHCRPWAYSLNCSATVVTPPLLASPRFGVAAFRQRGPLARPFLILLCNGSVCRISLATSFSTCGSALSSNASSRSVVRRLQWQRRSSHAASLLNGTCCGGGIAAGADASPQAPAIECFWRGVVPVFAS